MKAGPIKRTCVEVIAAATPSSPPSCWLRLALSALLALIFSSDSREANAADILVNEYNAVGECNFLQNGNSDPTLGTRLENGGDWIEFVVILDHLDLRGWDVVITNHTGSVNTS